MPIGHLQTAETRHKISESIKGINHPMYGRKHTIESKRKMSKSNKGKLVGSKNHFWNGGRVKQPSGYIYIYSPDHPFRDNKNYVREHRLVMEKFLGRPLLPMEKIHHINSDKTDNRIENLMLFNSESEHQHFHQSNK